jgi:hypothetical protein
MSRTSTLMALIAGIGVWMHAGVGAPQAASKAGFCEKLDARLGRLCQRPNLSEPNQALCARFRAGAPSLCDEAGGLFVSAAATDGVVALLDKDFEIMDVEDALAEPFFAPVVIGPADLDDPALMTYLREAYLAGETVAVTGANQEEADRFAMWIGGSRFADCRPSVNAPEITFFGLHRSLDRRPVLLSSYCFPDPIEAAPDLAEAQFLKYFAPEFPEETPTGAMDASRDIDLDDLADVKHCNAVWTNFPGFVGVQMSANVFVRSVRSFTNQTDFYRADLVLNYTADKFNSPQNFNAHTKIIDAYSSDKTIIDYSPQTISETVTSYKKGFSFSSGGGFRKKRGVLGVRSRLQVGGPEETVEVPRVKITATGNLVSSFISWDFRPASPLPPTGSLFSPKANVLWSAKRSGYPDDGIGEGPLGFFTRMSFEARPGQRVEEQTLECFPPYPFPTWEVDTPHIDSTDVPSVPAGGGRFKILGSAFYEGIVTDVILGGKRVPDDLVYFDTENQIQVTVPFDQPVRQQAPIEVRSEFEGERMVSNTDVTIQITEPVLPATDEDG